VFELHPRLAADTHSICQLTLSEVRLMNDSRFSWCILVPQRPNKTGVHQLTEADQQLLIAESSQVSNALESLFAPERINVGALGNVVSQLHWHVVARHTQDACWPGPVWGCGQAIPYTPEVATPRIEQLHAQITNLR